MEKFIYDMSLLGIAALFIALMASLAYSGLELLCWKYLEWKNKVEK